MLLLLPCPAEYCDKPLHRDFVTDSAQHFLEFLLRLQVFFKVAFYTLETSLSCANGRTECNSTSDFSKNHDIRSFTCLTGKTAKLKDMKPLSFLAYLFSGTLSVLSTCLVYARNNLRVQFMRVLPGGPTGPGGPGDPGGP